MNLRDGGMPRRHADQAHRMMPDEHPGHDPLLERQPAPAPSRTADEPGAWQPGAVERDRSVSAGSSTDSESGRSSIRARVTPGGADVVQAGPSGEHGDDPTGAPGNDRAPESRDPRDGGWDHPTGSPDQRPSYAGPGLIGLIGSRPPRRGGSTGPGATLRLILFIVLLGALVLGGTAVALGPVLARSITNWAAENAKALQLPFVADIVRSELGTSLTTPAGTSSATVVFGVADGETATTVGERLHAAGLVSDPRAFVFQAIERNATSSFKTGDHELRANMTLDEIISVLVDQPRDPHLTIALREGLRIEQITALLEKLKVDPPDPTKPLQMDVAAFYQLASHPTASLLADYPWLAGLPKGASLEGFLGPATYEVLPDITPEAFIREMLDHFAASVGSARMQVPAARHMTFYQVVTLASIVQLESAQASELPLIAGVYQNRLDGYQGVAKVLNADPTVIYGNDTVQLRKLPLDHWPQFAFWNLPTVPMGQVRLPADLLGYQTYTQDGPIPGPICTPTVATIDAALHPDTSTGYLFFVAKPDKSGTHAFARTNTEFQALLRQYGYAK